MSGLAGLLAGRRPCGVYLWRSRLALADVGRAAEHARWRPLLVDGRMVTDVRGLCDALAAAGDFPVRYRRTWEALAAGLTDLTWLPSVKGYLIVYEGWGMLARTDPAAWSAARRGFEEACGYWARTATPLAVILRGTGPAEGLPELV